MLYIFSQHFTGVLIYFLMILFDLSHSNISAYATFNNSSEEIKNIFSLSHDNNSISKGTGNFAEGGLIDDSFTQTVLNNFENSSKSLSNSHKTVHAFISNLNKKNVSSSYNDSASNKNYNPLQTTSIKTLLPATLVETESNLFLGVPEVVHINGTSSIKPRKGVHYSKIVPRKGVDNENEAFHVSLENQSCFWLSEKECYSNKGMECNCCKESNVLGENVKQTPVNCKNCKTFNVISSEQNQTCKNICCTAINTNFYSVSSTSNVFNTNQNYQTEPTVEKKQKNFSQTDTPKKITLDNDSSKSSDSKKNNSVVNFGKNLKFKPHITKVPYDAERMTELLGQTQEKVFVPLAVSLFLLPLMGIIIFFLWQRTKEYWNKRYYKRMDFLIDGIYND